MTSVNCEVGFVVPGGFTGRSTAGTSLMASLRDVREEIKLSFYRGKTKMVEVQVTSAETIRPSSSTPDHLRTFKLSMLDLLSPPMYVSFILFYSHDNGKKPQKALKSHLLKTSLADALALFFPLAGRLNEEENSVDCSDQGVDFIEAEVRIQLNEFLKLPNMEELLSQLLPCKDIIIESSTRHPLVAMQVNHFQCRGVAIGVSMSHYVADMATMTTFINGWAGMACGDGDAPHPTFDSASLFPATKVPRYVLSVAENISTKRFVFTGPSLASLRAKTATYTHSGPPTRVVALSALIWGCVTRATRKGGSMRALVAVHSVNMRSRMEPPLPDHSFGNLFLVVATSGVAEKDLRQGCLAEQLRDAFRQIDDAHIRDLLGPNWHLKVQDTQNILAENFSNLDIEFCSFTSWCGFPLYEVDFGWGKPAWVSAAAFPLKNAVVLLDRRWGDGIEAWVSLEKEDLARFEQDEELLSFVSNPVIV